MLLENGHRWCRKPWRTPAGRSISSRTSSLTGDELLNETLFFGLDHTRSVVAAWVADYNAARPRSALGYQTPEALPLNSPQWAIRFSHPKHCADACNQMGELKSRAGFRDVPAGPMVLPWTARRAACAIIWCNRAANRTSRLSVTAPS